MALFFFSLTTERAVQKLIERKRSIIKEHMHAMDEVNSMFFKDVVLD